MHLSLPFMVFLLNKVQPAIVIPRSCGPHLVNLHCSSYLCIVNAAVSVILEMRYCMPNASKLHDNKDLCLLCSLKVSLLHALLFKGKSIAVDYRGDA
jgi:hypothetical protein